ncbi:MAG: phasin family protein [Micavibrio aeruginosavorus]|uniref:Phasin family protein n=1 Tax=Micavibrio aeruginosavorus TaxID=349221 RepID=A0A7T5UI09_9BACT|nr:MAG: phasin family protein [Micavibrio aeruginosavorus]
MADHTTKKKASGTALVAGPVQSDQPASAKLSPGMAGSPFVMATLSFNPLRKTDIFKPMETLMTQNKTQYDKLANDAAAAGKENVEAFLRSTNIWVKGTEDLIKTCMTLAQENASKNSEAIKTIMGCKTLNELTEVQNKLAQETFDGFMAGATKLSELTVKLTTDALEPINDQVSKSIKKATESVAA